MRTDDPESERARPVPERATPIFVFDGDDLSVYAEVAHAEGDLEPWIVDFDLVTYDRLGNLLVIRAGGAGVRIMPADPPVNRYDEFIRRLRDNLLGYTVSFPGRLDGRRIEHATEGELVEYAVAAYKYDPTGPGVWGCLGSLLLGPALWLVAIAGAAVSLVAAAFRRVKGMR